MNWKETDYKEIRAVRPSGGPSHRRQVVADDKPWIDEEEERSSSACSFESFASEYNEIEENETCKKPLNNYNCWAKDMLENSGCKELPAGRAEEALNLMNEMYEQMQERFQRLLKLKDKLSEVQDERNFYFCKLTAIQRTFNGAAANEHGLPGGGGQQTTINFDLQRRIADIISEEPLDF